MGKAAVPIVTLPAEELAAFRATIPAPAIDCVAEAPGGARRIHGGSRVRSR